MSAANETRSDTLKSGKPWFEFPDRDRDADGAFGQAYRSWLLVEANSDRVLATIDGPDENQICYAVWFADGRSRKYISEAGAKRYAICEAVAILESERARPKRAARRDSLRAARR